MPRYITVLNSDLNKTYWKAIQEADSLAAIRQNRWYTAGVNLSLPKNGGDAAIEQKTVTESNTGNTAQATVLKLAPVTASHMNLARGTASVSLLKNLEKTHKNN